MKAPLSIVALALSVAVARAGLIVDEFNDTTIDAGEWTVVTRAPGASISESGGSAILINRGTLVSLDSFASYDITGRFQFTGGSDRFVVWTRTGGISTNDFFDLDAGVVFRFQQNSSKLGIDVWNSPTNQILTETTFSFANNAWYDFRVTDDGTNVALYLAGLSTPLLSATTNFVGGNRVAFNNDLNATTKIDFVQVVPEPSSGTVLFSVSFLGVALCCRRRLNHHSNACACATS